MGRNLIWLLTYTICASLLLIILVGFLEPFDVFGALSCNRKHACSGNGSRRALERKRAERIAIVLIELSASPPIDRGRSSAATPVADPVKDPPEFE